jgi:hypothetical protein
LPTAQTIVIPAVVQRSTVCDSESFEIALFKIAASPKCSRDPDVVFSHDLKHPLESFLDILFGDPSGGARV